MLAIYNIGRLYTMVPTPNHPLGVIENAALISKEDKILWCGPQKQMPTPPADSIDAEGKAVLPGFIDCHTHLIFAGDRSLEFALRAQGATYAEIMQQGGGIRSTMRHTREASEAELGALALQRLNAIARLGVTTVEVKTGYGLSIPEELKLLHVANLLNSQQHIEVMPTWMPAHAIPPEYEGQADAYVDLIITHLLENHKTLQSQLRFIDCFVEKGAFSVTQAKRLIETAHALHIPTRLHVEQLSHTGGTSLAADLKCISVSHLEHITPEDIETLSQHNIIAELLPIAQEYLGVPILAPARQLSNAGVKVAVATDFNPGSCMCFDLQLAARLAVTRCKLTCEEALLGITRYAADALLRPDLGRIAPQAQADFVLLSCSNANEMLYDWTQNPVKEVFKKGKKITLKS